MKRAILREYDQYGEDLSGHCARFSYRLMNLCVKAEEVSLLPVEVLIEGELEKLEKCCMTARKDEYSFMVVPKFEEDLSAVCQGVLLEHPEFKQTIETMTIDSIDVSFGPFRLATYDADHFSEFLKSTSGLDISTDTGKIVVTSQGTDGWFQFQDTEYFHKTAIRGHFMLNYST